MFENLNDIADAKSPTLIPAPIHVSQLILDMHRAKTERSLSGRMKNQDLISVCIFIHIFPCIAGIVGRQITL